MSENIQYKVRQFGKGEHDVSYDFSEQVITQVNVPVTFTAKELDNVIVTAFEGGITYWCDHVCDDLLSGVNIRKALGGKPVSMPFSQWCTHLILNGETLRLKVDGEKTPYELNMKKIKRGIRLYYQNGHTDLKDDYDAGDADSFIQYALFGEIVYG
jgi:hypothetical protein